MTKKELKKWLDDNFDGSVVAAREMLNNSKPYFEKIVKHSRFPNEVDWAQGRLERVNKYLEALKGFDK